MRLFVWEKTMAFGKEFKDFIMRGNVVDMAVGIIIGAAFGKIVSSLVKDVIMPPIGHAMGGVNFDKLMYVLQEATEKTEVVAIKYGAFMMTIIDFLIIALTIFVALKVIEKMKKKEEAEEAAPSGPSQEELLTEIRDLLNK
jgi:large conductance mechanosensitive channel